MTYFKVLSFDNRSYHGGNVQLTWALPTQQADGTWTPGEWMPQVDGDLEPCQNGYHLTDMKSLLRWLWSDVTVYEAEPSEEMVDGGDKVTCRSVRLLRKLHWSDRIARAFACDCVYKVLAIWEKEQPQDMLPRHAVETARMFIAGNITPRQLATARAEAWETILAPTGSASQSAVSSEAWYVARAAVGTLAPPDVAFTAARDAAKLALRAAANAAVQEVFDDSVFLAAWKAQENWQNQRLMQYLEGTT